MIPTETVEKRLKALYWAGAGLLLVAVAYHSFVAGLHVRSIYGLVATATVIGFGHYVVFGRRVLDPIMILKPVLFFNVVIVVLFYYGSLEWGLTHTEFKAAWYFGNFWDFYAIVLSQAERTYQWVSTGYLPFAYALSKVFAKLMMWSPDHHDFNTRTSLVYFGYVFVSMSPLALLGRGVAVANRLSKEQIFFFAVFLMTCYPVFFTVERGNYVMVSFFFLGLAIFSYDRGRSHWAAFFLGLLVALKVFNVVFALFVLRRCYRQFGTFVVTVLATSLASLIYLFRVHPVQWAIFKSVFLVPVGGMVATVAAPIETDSGKLSGGTTGFEAFRILLRTLFYSVKDNMTSDSATLNLVMMVVGIACIGCFYVFCRRRTDWVDEILVLAIVPMLFHPASGSYNLMLVLPALMVIACRKPAAYDAAMLRFAGLFLMLSSGIVISTITCCYDVPGRYTSVTPESFLVPFSLLSILAMIFARNSGPGEVKESVGVSDVAARPGFPT